VTPPSTGTAPILFRLITLGETRLLREIDGESAQDVLRGGKVIGLLIYLACQDGRTVAREELADLLWGDEAPENAKASLRQALYALRRLLGASVLSADRQRVTLVPGRIAVDRDVFIAGARRGDLAPMLAAYGGPFCARLDVGSARRFLEWVEEERQRLRQLLLEQGQRTLPPMVQAGPSGPALALARQLHALEPGDDANLVILVDALIAGGAIDEARERVTSAIAVLRASGEPIPELLQLRAQRLARQDPAAPPRRGTLDALGHHLLGREPVVEQLLRESERARLGEPRRLLLTGPVGIGKTRLLDEVEARLRLRGARVVRIRLLPAMREVPYAALADITRALAQLPGSLGIAESAASELVTLLPELATRFPSARPSGMRGEDRRRYLREALAELLAAVADERLVVLIVEDLGGADDVSRQVLAGVTRGAGVHLLEVYSARSGLGPEAVAAERVLVLPPFGLEEIRSLLEGVAPLPAAPWVAAFLDALTARSRGIPQLALQRIRAAVEGKYLVPSEAGWRCEDPDRLLAELARGSWFHEGLDALAPRPLRLLTLLARWQLPLDERDLVAVVRATQDRVTDAEVAAALRRLETLGLVTSRDTYWSVAHASVSDALAERATPLESRQALASLLRHWSHPDRLDMERLEHLALLVGATAERLLIRQLARAAARAPRLRAIELRGRRLAERIARAAGHPEWEGDCLRAMGFLARQNDHGLALVGAAGALAVASLLWVVLMLQPRLRFEVEPLAEGPTRGAVDLAVQPRLILENGFGRPYRWSVLAKLSATDAVTLGDTLRPLVDGRAQFERIAIRVAGDAVHDRDVVLRAKGPWFVRSGRASVRGSRLLQTDGTFRIIATKVDGVALGPDLAVVVPPRDSIRLTLTFEYTTTRPTANYVVGALPTWGRREREVIRLAGLPSPVFDAWRTVSFSVPAPPPGTHHIVLLFAAEDEVDFLFSLTNWTYGRPRWNDGSDVPDLGVDAFETLRQQGYVDSIPYLHARHSVRVGSAWYPRREAPPMEAVYEVPVRLTGSAIRVRVDSTVTRSRAE
jgi:DNA-binding SARP family transcriptional activator